MKKNDEWLASTVTPQRINADLPLQNSLIYEQKEVI
jgi:hypothetical protein